MEIFSRLHDDGATILLVTHEREIALFAERIIYLKDGMITGDEKASDTTLKEFLREDEN
jgi:putative ABC transport system ATP-binding protein